MSVTTKELDRIKTAYAKRVSTQGFYSATSVFWNTETERDFIALLHNLGLAPLEDKRILDVGTAGGYFLRMLLKYGVPARNLVGVDIWHSLMREGLEIVPCIGMTCADAQALPFVDGSFDIAVQQTMLSSVIDPDLRYRIAREMLRVVRRGGFVFSYDFRVKRPGDRDVHAITRRELRNLFPDCEISLRPCGVIPHLVRAFAGRSMKICALASLLLPIKTHYWAAIRKV
jgi:ubiquinone/menaquinone biosynthesis C-methylase UbiE